MKFICSILFLLSFLTYSASSQSYDMVRTYGTDCGKVAFLAPANVQYELLETAVLSDGKTLLLGNTYNSVLNNYTISMIRLDACGILDNSFGTNGIVDFTFNQRNFVNDFKVDSTGRIYCAGYEAPGNGLSDIRAFVARFNYNGSPDTSFGTGGRVVEYNSAIANSSSNYTAILLYPDGKVVAWGSEGPNASGGGSSCISRRYNTDGSLDSTFNPPANYPTMSSLNQQIVSLSWAEGFLQDDGSIFFSYVNNNNQVVFVNLTDSGTLNTAFHTTGYSVLPMTSIGTFPSMMQLSDGSWRGVITQQPFAEVIQVQTTGDMDSTFGTNGILQLPHIPGTNNSESANDLWIDSQGRTWVFGSASGPFGQPYGNIWRLDAGNALDMTFEGLGYKYFYSDGIRFFRSITPLQNDRMFIGLGYNYSAFMLDAKDKVLSIEQGASIDFCTSTTISTTCSQLSIPCYSYQWYKDGTPTGGNSASLVITQPGDYNVIATYLGGTDTSANVTASFIQNPLPTVYQSNDTLFSQYSGVAMTWQWYLNSNVINGATEQNYVTNGPGSYTVAVTDSNACSSTSSSFIVTGISDQTITTSFNLYPNPSHDVLNVQLSNLSGQDVSIQLINAAGRIVLDKFINVETNAIDLLVSTKHIPTGVYLCRVVSSQNVSTKKITITH